MVLFDEIIDRSNTDCIKYDGMSKFLGVADAIPMWVADMDFRTPSFVIDALRNRLSHELLGYGLRNDTFFEAVAGWMKRRHQWDIEKNWVVFVPGVVPAVNIAVLAFTEPGDKVIVQPPVYFPFFNAVTDHGRELVYNRLIVENNRHFMDFEDLERQCSSGARMVILSNPHNPGGRAWEAEELRRLAEICLRNNVLMFSDEIHCDLVYKPYHHTPLASLGNEISAATLTTTAASKTFNLSGLSSAIAIISDKSLRKKFSDYIDHLHIGLGNVFGNIATEAAYRNGDRWVDVLMQYLGANLEILSNYLKANNFPIKMMWPEATFLVWLDCHEMNMNDDDLNRFFLEKAGLGLNRGDMFGPGGNGYMRMNIACPSSVLLTALEKLKTAFNTF